MTNLFYARTCLLIMAALVAVNLQARAELHYVGVNDSGFLPDTLNIHVGDTVVWINIDSHSAHTTTSDVQFPDANAWHALLAGAGSMFSRSFNAAGTFTYRDQVDNGTGRIVVTELNEPPEIVLVSPRITGGQFIFEATGLTAGRENVLEFSTNLIHWIALRTNLANSTSMTYTNSSNPGGSFFRVRQLL